METALGRSDRPSPNTSSQSGFGQDKLGRSRKGYNCATFVACLKVASRELRNDTAGVLRRVREGEDVTITVNGRAVAMLTALGPQRRRWLSKAELLSRLRRAQADPGLRQDLATLAGDTTEDLGPIR